MRSSLLLLPLVSGCALFTLAATKRSHPELEGTFAAAGAQADLTIKRDAMGVPHVRAESPEDAWYGLGYAHAQDRLFQADMNRRLATGRIAEWLGERAVNLDVFVGTMDLETRGQGMLDRASPEVKAAVKAYTVGFNAGAGSLKTLPVEYRLLGVPFEPWKEVDTTGVLFLQAWSLQENLDHELAALAFDHLSADKLDPLFDTYPNTPPIDTFWDEVRTQDVGSLTDGFKAFTGALGGRPEANAQASNNWIIGGSKTASGKPIVANDPHLVQRVPSLWYAADIQGGDLHVAGATLPGTVGFPVGHNERVAWGLTNVMADTVDLAVVKRDGDTVRIEGKEEKVETRTFEIRPRDADPVERTVEWTSMGPIVNSGGDYAMVMRWTGLMADDQTMDMLHSMAVSTNVEDLRTEIRSRVSIAPQNVVMADVDGAIGWTVMGTFPRRHGFTGRVPYPASENTLHYDGWLDDIPGELSPARDYLATANNKPDHPGADAIATAYLPPWRYDRIMEVLDSHEEATPADMHELHLDVQDGAAKVFLPTLLDGVSTTGPGAPCLDKLRGWDFEATTDSAEAAIWGTFQEQLLREVFKAHLDAEDLSLLLDLMTSGRHPLATLEPFVDGGDLKKPVAAALDATCTALSAKLGPDASTWTWGAMHPLKLKHPFGDQSSLLSGWNMDPAPFPGTGATVAAAGYKWSDEEWKVGFMTSLRIVMPLDDLGASTFVHPGGQAGQPKSPHYRSHYDAFLAGETLPLWFDDADVDANSTHTLILNAE